MGNPNLNVHAARMPSMPIMKLLDVKTYIIAKAGVELEY
jgi:hypothetical protein